MGEPIKLLVVGSRARPSLKQVERVADDLVVQQAEGKSAALDQLGDVDCLLSVQDLPEGSGLELLRAVRDREPSKPFVLAPADGSEALASEAIAAGVTDYLRLSYLSASEVADRVEAAVEESPEHPTEGELYEKIFNTMQEGACLYDTDGRFAVVNAFLAETYGTTTEELLGRESRLIEAIRAESDGDPYRELVEGERGQLSGEAAVDMPDAGTEIVEYRLTSIREGDRCVGVVGVARHITELKKRMASLEQAREEYRELIDAINDTVWVMDFDGAIIDVNRTAIEDLGYSRKELEAKSIHDIDAGIEPERLDTLLETLPEDEIQVFETVHRGADGGEVPVEVISSPITYKGDPAVLSVARDITAHKERERRLEQFASIVSHDLRNPLNVAEGRLDLAKSDCESEHFAGIETAHDRMRNLIDDLLTLARTDRELTEIEPISLATLGQSCWKNVDTGDARIRVTAERSIVADRTRLSQLLENLMRNTIDHAGSDVTVTIGPLEDGFYVEDDGTGIPPDQREQVFEPGYSTRVEGTGVGLAIVRRIADAHGWSVSLIEGEAGGARFEIRDVEFAEA